MKMKWNLKILLWSTLPICLCYMMNFIASLAYWGQSDYMFNLTIKDFNHPLACCVALVGLVTIIIVVLTSIRLMYVADDIDRLEQSKKEYEDAKYEMEIARDKYTELLLNEANDKAEWTK
jgi:hypothetical protein